MVTLVRESHALNALSPMVVTLSGMVTLVRESHQRNALSPMAVTPSGMVTLIRKRQEANALSPMAVTACPSSVSGMDSSDAEPVYLAIAAVSSGWRV